MMTERANNPAGRNDESPARRNEDLLKDSPETGEEGYTENFEATRCEFCGCQSGILILPDKKGGKDQ